MSTQKSHVQVRLADDVVTITLTDPIIYYDNLVGLVKDALYLVARETTQKTVCVDLSQVKNVSSQFWGMLIRFSREMKASSRALKVCNVSEDMFSSLQTMGLVAILGATAANPETTP